MLDQEVVEVELLCNVVVGRRGEAGRDAGGKEREGHRRRGFKRDADVQDDCGVQHGALCITEYKYSLHKTAKQNI